MVLTALILPEIWSLAPLTEGEQRTWICSSQNHFGYGSFYEPHKNPIYEAFSPLQNFFGGHADWLDVVTERNRLPQAQQCNIPIKILLPVIFGMDDDFVQQGNFFPGPLMSSRSPKKEKSNGSI